MDADLDNEIELQEQQESDALFDEQWSHVMAGLDRAVAWIKDNKWNLREGFDVRFSLNKKHGIEIALGYFWASDQNHAERRKAIRSMFSGKKVKRTVNPCDMNENYSLVDDELQLTFTWVVWRSKECKRTETEIVL